ncbi:hypothetical protein [Chthonobacter rhizosphaerae]|uniref:hypothetical protein n=1 Tax=Chthonobacter rhizosphaerae TaxID=2735553 RepID=UPI0015EFD6E9|nr:hypothetical protein [Chthonobacter rhizosphaerae]
MEFRLHAPDAATVELLLGSDSQLEERDGTGFSKVVVAGVAPGTDHAFRVDGRDVREPAADLFGEPAADTGLVTRGGAGLGLGPWSAAVWSGL